MSRQQRLGRMLGNELEELMTSFVYEKVSGNESFSLPFANILIVVLVGSVLFWWFGWRSTFIVLAVYGVFCIVGGLVDR